MFTGIIEETGAVERVKKGAGAIELTVRVAITGRGLKIGDSLAVNGCCLTVAGIKSRGARKVVRFDMLQETWRRTNFKNVKAGSLVNLERPLTPSARLGGHFVTGHIDATGVIRKWEQVGQDRLLEVAASVDVMRYIVQKGSIAIDGISLTVAVVRKKSFDVWVIPHTFKVTALQERSVGDAVNLETDLLGKYVEKFVGRNLTAKNA